MTNVSYNYKFYYYVLMIIVVLTSGSIQGLQIGVFKMEIIFIILSIPIIINVFLLKKYFIKLMIFFLILLNYLILNSLNYHQTWVNLLRYILILFILTIIVIQSYRKSIQLHEILYRIILFIATYSMVFYILIAVIKLPIGYNIVNSPGLPNYYNYFNIYYIASSTNIFGNFILRNSSIFWEPGVYQIYLNFALYVFLFLKKSKKKSHFILIVISIISTFSTTGIILALFIIINKYYKSMGMNTSKKQMTFIVFILLLFVSINISISVISNKKQNSQQSYDSRFSDFKIPLKLFYTKPLLGYGYANQDIFYVSQQQQNVYWDTNRGGSNGLLNFLYQQGILGMVLIIFPFFNEWKNSGDKKNIKKTFIIFYFISCSTEPVLVTTFMTLWLGTSYAQYFLKKNFEVEF